MPKVTFSIEEVLAIQANTMDDVLAAKVSEMKSYEANKSLRDAAVVVLKANTQEFVSESLEKLKIPDGVTSIDLIYDYGEGGFAVRSGGVKVTFAGEGSVSEDLTRLITKAEEQKASKDGRPLSFITGVLGD